MDLAECNANHIIRPVAEILLTGVNPLGAKSHKFIFIDYTYIGMLYFILCVWAGLVEISLRILIRAELNPSGFSIWSLAMECCQTMGKVPNYHLAEFW